PSISSYLTATAPTAIYPLSLHDALPIYPGIPMMPKEMEKVTLPPYVIEPPDILLIDALSVVPKPPYHIAPLDSLLIQVTGGIPEDRKSTRLNSSHVAISYAVFCLKKKKK